MTRRDFLAQTARFAAATSFFGYKSLRAAAASAPAPAGERRRPIVAYVGTYTPGGHFAEPYNAAEGNGQGIHLFELDPETGTLSPREVVANDASPNCLAFNPARTHLFSTNRGSGAPGPNSGSVSSYAVDPRDGHLTLVNTIDSGGAGPAHLSVHPSGKYVLVANYIGGSIAVLPIKPGGELGAATDIREDRGPVGRVQAASAPAGSFAISGHDAPHAHMIQADPAGRFILSTDLGLDRIYSWGFDADTGRLRPNDPPWVQLPSGDGARYFAFHPNGRRLYSVQEESSTLTWFDYDPADGRLTLRGTGSTLPPGFAGTSFTSGVLLSPDGRFLYVGNRLHDSIAIFALDVQGTPTWVAEEWTRGDYPRSFNFDPAGSFLCVCNQRSDVVATFRVDRRSGRLSFTGHYTPIGSPSVILFFAP